MNHNESHRHRSERLSPIEANLAAPPIDANDDHPETKEPLQGEVLSQEASAGSSISQSKWTVIAILFLVTGALGLPLLWINQRFSNLERYLWAIAVIAYTAALVGVTISIVSWTYSRLFP